MPFGFLFICLQHIWLCDNASHNLNIKTMTKEVHVLHCCGDCINKVVDESLPKGAFRCPLIAGIIQTDVVWYDTDATDCVRSGRYHGMIL